MIALHAALLARKTGRAGADDLRPPRGHRGDDQAPPGDRPPPDRRHDATARLVAQDIELVMDGGAYCTLTPVVLSRGDDPRRRPVRRCPNVRIRARATSRRTRRPTARSAASGRPRPSSRPRRSSTASPRRSACRRSRSAGATSTGSATRPRPARSCATASAGEEVLERAAEAGEFERRDRTRGRRAERARAPGRAPARDGPRGHRPGPRLARRRVHRLRRGQAGLGRLPRADRRGPDPHPDRVDRDGPGDEDDLPAARRRGARASPIDDVEIAPQDTAFVPDSGPTVASRTAMVVGGLLIKAARRLRAEVEARDGRPVRRDLPRRRPRPRRDPHRPALRALSGVARFDDATYTGDAYPAFGWAACRRARSRSIWTPARSHVRRRRRGRRRRPGHPPGPVPRARSRAARSRRSATRRSRRSSCATAATSTTGSRRTSSRPSLDAPRIDTILVEAPFDGAPHGAKGVGELPMDVGAPAVIAAIHDATGAWIDDLPATPGADPGRAGRDRGPGAPAVAGLGAAGRSRRAR